MIAYTIVRVMIAALLSCDIVASAGSPRHVVHPEGRAAFGFPQEKPTRASLIQEAEREGFAVRRTEFLGNARTADMVLRRRLVLTEGDLFTRERLEHSIRRLSRLNVIKPVRLRDVEIKLDREHKIIDLAFLVRERRRAR